MTNSRQTRERGYALPEVLIATAIAAAVLAAAASAAAGLVRLETATTERAALLDDARIISARLRAGMSDADTLDGVSGWRIERATFEDASIEQHRPAFDVLTISYGDDAHSVFELLVPHSETQP